MKLYCLFLRYTDNQSRFRIVVTVFAVMLATISLSTIVALGQGWMSRIQKDEMLSALFPYGSTQDMQASTKNENTVYITTNDTEFDSLLIKEIGIRKTNASESLPAGLTDVPADNEIWVTPALKILIKSKPLLSERYRGYIIKDSFPKELTSSPETLLLLYKIPDSALEYPTAQILTISTDELRSIYQKYSLQNSSQLTVVRTALLLTGIVLITPILILVVEATRIGIVQREKKYAVLSLAGATNAQMQSLAIAETSSLSLIGVILGAVLFALICPYMLSSAPIGGSTIWIYDMRLSIQTFVIICGIVVLCSVITNLQALRLVNISPLSVSRIGSVMKRPSLLTVLPLIFGIGGVYYISQFGESWRNSNTELSGVVLGALLLLVMLGIFMSGSYLTFILSNVLIKTSHGASTLIAAFRLRTTPQRTFHSISGVIIALFVGTLLMTFLATMQSANNALYKKGDIASAKYADPLQLPRQITVNLAQISTQKTSMALVQELLGEKRLKNIAYQAYIQKGFKEDSTSDDENNSGNSIVGNYYDSCTQLLQRTKLVCNNNLNPNEPLVATTQLTKTENGEVVIRGKLTPTSGIPGTVFDESYVIVAKDDTSFKLAQEIVDNIASRYHIETGDFVSVSYPAGDDSLKSLNLISNLSSIIAMMVAATIVVGGLGILISTTGGLFERKRSFIGLRVLGASVGTLTKSLLIEVIVPLVVLSAITVGLGIFCSYHLLHAMGVLSGGLIYFSLPGTIFWVGICVAITISTLASLLNIPLLSHLTDFSKIHTE